jgi:predicted short-subunit dehydrogenase-like oxidoreductase (DUF2520 family)
VVGVGRVGGSLALALATAGYAIDLLVHRGTKTAEAIVSHLSPRAKLVDLNEPIQITSDIVLVTTADQDIRRAARELVSRISSSAIVLHTSGSLSSEVLADLAAGGCSTGSMHPLVSITDAISSAHAFAGTYFCIEGDDRAVAAARSIAEALDAKPFSIPTDKKPLYHAAAVTACGHLVALIDVAVEMLSKCGVTPETAKDVLMPLIASTIDNLETRTPSQALTGSFARADVAGVEAHLQAMDGTVSDEIREIYLALGARSIELANSNGTDPKELDRLRKTISVAKRKPE